MENMGLSDIAAVRYPNSTTFTAGYNPYFSANTCGCGTAF